MGHTKQSCTYAIRATIRSGHTDTRHTHAHWEPERRRTCRECAREEPSTPWSDPPLHSLIGAFGSRGRRSSSPSSDFSPSGSLVNSIVLEPSALRRGRLVPAREPVPCRYQRICYALALLVQGTRGGRQGLWGLWGVHADVNPPHACVTCCGVEVVPAPWGVKDVTYCGLGPGAALGWGAWVVGEWCLHR